MTNLLRTAAELAMSGVTSVAADPPNPDPVGSLSAMASVPRPAQPYARPRSARSTPPAAEAAVARPGTRGARRPRARRVRPGRPARRPPHPPGPPREPGRGRASPTTARRSSSTAPAACAPPSPPRRCRSSGYTDVVSMAGGFGKWKDEGRPWRVPVTLTPDQRNRYQRHLLLPEVGVAGPGQAAREQGPAPRGGRARLPGRPLPGRRRRGHARHRRHGRGRRLQPAAPDPPQPRPGRRAQGRLGQEDADRPQPRRQRGHLRHPARRPRTCSSCSTGYDVVIDGADNFPSRYLLNDASVKLGIPVVHGSIFRFEGMVTVFDPKRGPNYRDMVPEPPPADLAPICAEAGVLGRAARHHRRLQALEAIKLLLDLGDPLIGRILSFDALEMTLPHLQAAGRPDQPGHLGEPGRHRDRRVRRALRPAPVALSRKS